MYALNSQAFKLTVSTENYLNTATFGWLSIWIIFVIESVSKLAFHKTKVSIHIFSLLFKYILQKNKFS